MKSIICSHWLRNPEVIWENFAFEVDQQWTNENFPVYPMPSTNSESFSEGGKFKSKQKGLPPFNFFTAGTSLQPSITFLCLLIWPPNACPIANSRPHIEHSCTLGLAFCARFCSSSTVRGLLWLARCPPSAWNEGNRRWQVLHSNTRAEIWATGSCSSPSSWPPPRDSNISQLATWVPSISPWNSSPPSPLKRFMAYDIDEWKLREKLIRMKKKNGYKSSEWRRVCMEDSIFIRGLCNL